MSPYDHRLLTLAGVIKSLAEELAIYNDQSPREAMAEALYTISKNVHIYGKEKYMNELLATYPMLKEAIS